MFMLLNKGLDFGDSFLVRTGLDGYLRLPMSNEQVVIPAELIESLIDNLKNYQGVGKTNQKPIKQLIELMNKHKKLLS